MQRINHRDRSLPDSRSYETDFLLVQMADFSQTKYLPPLTMQHRKLLVNQKHLCIQKTLWSQDVVFDMPFVNPSLLAVFPRKHCTWQPCFLTTFENHSQEPRNPFHLLHSGCLCILWFQSEVL